MKIAAFTASKTYTSARFRVRQFIPVLKERGIDVSEFIAPIYKHQILRYQNGFYRRLVRYGRPLALLPSVAASHFFSASWIQREFIWGRDTLEQFTGRPRLFDVDDAIWLDREGSAAKSIARIGQRVDVVIAGNEIIASWFADKGARDVRVIHTAIDTDRYVPSPNRHTRDAKRCVLVWTGQQVTAHHLYHIEGAIHRFFAEHPEAELVVVSDEPPTFRQLAPERVRFVRWTQQVEVNAIQQGDIGLMPLINNEHARAKCSFKMLQCMACEMPVVVTPVGLNAEILAMSSVGIGANTEDEWVDAFEQLYRDRDAAHAMGKNGRKLAVERFSRDLIGSQLAALFKEVAE